MKIRDKRFDALRGGHVEGKKDDVGVKQTQQASRTPLVENEAGGAAAKAALRALALDADSDVTTVRTKGGDMGLMGAKLMSQVAEHKEGKSKGTFMAKAGALGALGISLLGMVQPAAADVVYLDFNNGVEEIKTARKMAQTTGEDFHLVRPTKDALEQTFARAEAGEIDLSTLVLSGHSLGTSVWGSGPNKESFRADIKDFKELKEKYPKAFEQVKHVFFMACYAGGKAHSASWNEVFPNARAVVGFYGSGPASHRPASSWVLKNVEAALDQLPDSTLSPQQALLKAKQIAGLKGPNQTKFGIRLDGVHYQHGAKETSNAELVLEQVQFARNQTFTPFFEATAGHENTPTNHQVSPLRDYYNQVQAALNQVEPGTPEAESLNRDIATTIRLIYFDNVAKNVELEHRSDFNAANAELTELGVDVKIPSDIRQLTRAEVLAVNAQLQGVEDAGARLTAKSEGGEAIAKSNAWLESKGEALRLSFDGVEDAGDIRSRMRDVKKVIDARTFSVEDQGDIETLRAGAESLSKMSAGEKSGAVKGHLNARLNELRDDVSDQLTSAGSSLTLPDSVDRDSARALAAELRSISESATSSTWRMDQLATHLERWAGEPGQSDEQLLLKDFVADNRSDLSDLAGKLERLGSFIKVPSKDAELGELSAADLAGALKEAKSFAAAAEGAPADVIAALDALRAKVDGAAGSSAIERSRDIFEHGLHQLTTDAVPDNWITD